MLDAGCDPFASALSLASAACSWGGARICVLRFFEVVGGAVGGDDDDDDDDAVVSGVLVGGLSIAASSWAAFAMRPEVVRVLNLGLGFGFGLTGMLARVKSGRGVEMVVFESWTVLLLGYGDCDQGDVDGGVD